MKVPLRFLQLLSLLEAVQLQKRDKEGGIISVSWPHCEEEWPPCPNRGSANTVCLTKTCAPEGSECYEYEPEMKFRTWMVEYHNKLRNQVGSGQENRNGISAAANMMALSYDLSLEYTAMCQANKCVFDHDSCRITKKFKTAGQNIHKASIRWSAGRKPPLKELEQMFFYNESAHTQGMQNWYDEISLEKDFTKYIDDFELVHSTGHFTALIWAESSYIGCSSSLDNSQEQVTWLLYCNYGPAGNVHHKKIYLKGTGCSKCPEGVSCNPNYSGLCGPVDMTGIDVVGNPYRNREKEYLKNNSTTTSFTEFNHCFLIFVLLFVFAVTRF